MKRSDNAGQMTIFIIVAIILVVAIALVFLFRSGIVGDVFTKTEKNPESVFRTCIEDEVYLAIENIEHRGGYLNDKKYIHFSFIEEGEYYDIAYLCYTGVYNKKCTNIAPFLILDMEKQIKDSLDDEVYFCLGKLKDNLENQAYAVEGNFEDYDFNVDLIRNKIILNIGIDITLTKSGETTTSKDFKIIFPTEIYNFADIAVKIANDEASDGDSDFKNYIDYSKDMDIDLFTTTESFSKIYTIQNTQTEEFLDLLRGGI